VLSVSVEELLAFGLHDVALVSKPVPFRVSNGSREPNLRDRDKGTAMRTRLRTAHTILLIGSVACSATPKTQQHEQDQGHILARVILAAESADNLSLYFRETNRNRSGAITEREGIIYTSGLTTRIDYVSKRSPNTRPTIVTTVIADDTTIRYIDHETMSISTLAIPEGHVAGINGLKMLCNLKAHADSANADILIRDDEKSTFVSLPVSDGKRSGRMTVTVSDTLQTVSQITIQDADGVSQIDILRASRTKAKARHFETEMASPLLKNYSERQIASSDLPLRGWIMMMSDCAKPATRR